MDQENEGNVDYLAALPGDREYSSIAGLLRRGQAVRLINSPAVDLNLTWQQKVSMIFVKILWHNYGLLAWVGLQIEWLLNYLTLNGGLWRSLNMYFNVFEWGKSRLLSSYETLLRRIDSADGRSRFASVHFS